MNDIFNSSTVLDRELEEEKSHDSSGARIRCPLCGWSPRKEDKWFCTCGNEWNTFDTGGVAQRACTSGLRPSACHVAAGRHIRIGIPVHEFGNRRRRGPDYLPYPLFYGTFSMGDSCPVARCVGLVCLAREARRSQWREGGAGDKSIDLHVREGSK